MDKNKEILDEIETLNSIDKNNMLALIGKMPDMMVEGWAAAENTNPPQVDQIDNMVISGMGGSAISGDIVSYVLKDVVKFPVLVNRNYSCPKFVNENTLYFALSYSGNTEETIASFKEAVTKKAKIISISSGGDLMELSRKNKVPHIEIPKGLPPRAALGYILPPVLNMVQQMRIANIKDDFDVSVNVLKQAGKKLNPACETRENPAKQIAVKLYGKIPAILTSVGTTYPAGLRWKTQLNENSKTAAYLCAFPELNHNDMVNFSFLKPSDQQYCFIALRDEADLERMKKRIEITKSLISGLVGGITEVWAQGKTPLEKMMNLIQVGDYVSAYLAVLSGIDPTPVDMIERLKKELAR